MLKDSHKPTREEQALDEIRRTRVTPAMARITVGLFLAVIGVVPLIQHLDVFNRYRLGFNARAWPACYELGGHLRTAAQVYTATPGSLPRRVFAANRRLLPELDGYTLEIEESSWMTRLALPPTQWAMTRWFGVGNEKVYPGRGGWLFYRPDVDFVAGTSFLDLKGRLDPVACVADFNRQLRARGIRLIVMPVPPKVAIYPGRFAGAGNMAPLHNPAYPEFFRRLRQIGVTVLDVAPILDAGSRQTGRPLYLATDTHWRPEGMELVARELADTLAGTGMLTTRVPSGFRRQECEATSLGDTAALIKTPASQPLAALETVTLSQILRPDGMRWTKSREAEVLVLGDSFANIYSLASMGWGASAGLVEQLAFLLQRPLDSITFNDRGAHATRQELARQMKQDPARLHGKKCVVWEFAARELAFGDWTCIPLE